MEEKKGCITSLQNCWAKIFWCCGKNKDNSERIHLMHPDARSLQTKDDADFDVAPVFEEAEMMWKNYIEGHSDLTDQSRFEDFSKDRYVITCYQRFRLAGDNGDVRSQEYLSKFPPKLRLVLDNALKDFKNLQSFRASK